MPRNYKLTWQAGVTGRGGRWRKKYRGKVYHFPGGRGKCDREAYDAAVESWEKQKLLIDADAPKPNARDYLRAIAEWESVLTWCRNHGDESMAEVAVEKLGQLKTNFAKRKPEPVRIEDTFAGQFDEDVRYPGLNEMLAKTAEKAIGVIGTNSFFGNLPGYEDYCVATDKFLRQFHDGGELNSNPVRVEPSKLHIEEIEPLRIERAVWGDRLKMMQVDTPLEQTLKSFIDRFVESKKASASAGELSIGRASNLQSHVEQFAAWLGHNTPVVEIKSQTLSDYRLSLLNKVEANQWSRTTANDRLSSVKSFVRWLWQIEAIPALPRIMDSKSNALNIGISQSKIVVFSKAEIKVLLKKASDRTRLYILLMLNCGMTQKDIADLEYAEVDWKAGRITRKRSKTRKHQNVPEVCYKLWSTTLRLLKQERNKKTNGKILLNANGTPLWSDDVTAKGKYRKNDNVKSAFQRLKKVTKINKPLKSLKKTSATLIRGSEKYASLESLFLGHAGGTIAHRHYAQAPQKMLDDAIDWLATEYGID